MPFFPPITFTAPKLAADDVNSNIRHIRGGGNTSLSDNDSVEIIDTPPPRKQHHSSPRQRRQANRRRNNVTNQQQQHSCGVPGYINIGTNSEGNEVIELLSDKEDDSPTEDSPRTPKKRPQDSGNKRTREVTLQSSSSSRSAFSTPMGNGRSLPKVQHPSKRSNGITPRRLPMYTTAPVSNTSPARHNTFMKHQGTATSSHGSASRLQQSDHKSIDYSPSDNRNSSNATMGYACQDNSKSVCMSTFQHEGVAHKALPQSKHGQSPIKGDKDKQRSNNSNSSAMEEDSGKYHSTPVRQSWYANNRCSTAPGQFTDESHEPSTRYSNSGMANNGELRKEWKVGEDEAVNYDDRKDPPESGISYTSGKVNKAENEQAGGNSRKWNVEEDKAVNYDDRKDPPEFEMSYTAGKGDEETSVRASGNSNNDGSPTAGNNGKQEEQQKPVTGNDKDMLDDGSTRSPEPDWWYTVALMEQTCSRCGRKILPGHPISKNMAVKSSVWTHCDCNRDWGTPKSGHSWFSSYSNPASTHANTSRSTPRSHTSQPYHHNQTSHSDKTSASPMNRSVRSPGASTGRTITEAQWKRMEINRLAAIAKRRARELERSRCDDVPSLTRATNTPGRSSTSAVMDNPESKTASFNNNQVSTETAPSVPTTPSLPNNGMNQQVQRQAISLLPSDSSALRFGAISNQEERLMIEQDLMRMQAMVCDGAAGRRNTTKTTKLNASKTSKESETEVTGLNAPKTDDNIEAKRGDAVANFHDKPAVKHKQGESEEEGGNTSPEDDYEEDDFLVDCGSALDKDDDWSIEDDESEDNDNEEDEDEQSENEEDWNDVSDKDVNSTECGVENETDNGSVRPLRRSQRKTKPVQYYEEDAIEYDDDGNKIRAEWDDMEEDHNSDNPFGSDNDDDVSIRTEDEQEEDDDKDKLKGKRQRQTEIGDCRPFYIKKDSIDDTKDENGYLEGNGNSEEGDDDKNDETNKDDGEDDNGNGGIYESKNSDNEDDHIEDID